MSPNNLCSSDQRCFVNTLREGRCRCPKHHSVCAWRAGTEFCGDSLCHGDSSWGPLKLCGSCPDAALAATNTWGTGGSWRGCRGAVVTVSRVTSSTAPRAGWPFLRGSNPQAEAGLCSRPHTLLVLLCSPQQLLLHSTVGCFQLFSLL